MGEVMIKAKVNFIHAETKEEVTIEFSGSMDEYFIFVDLMFDIGYFFNRMEEL
jgi:hypothetical protein